ncbi:TMEM175 family protein [Spirosoma areae]
MAQFQFGSFTKARVETFSDGVFVVIVTLLVFDLKFPKIDAPTNAAVWQGILVTMPKLLSWVNSRVGGPISDCVCHLDETVRRSGITG